MRIVVCVKHVPDADSDRRIEQGRLVRGEDDVLNELDEHAIEAAVSIVEDLGGEVVALTMGPADSEDALVRALQMGADRGVLISDDSLAGADAVGTARILARAIEVIGDEGPVDLVLTGMASLDGMTSMLAPALATYLNWPLLDIAHSVEIAADAPSTLTVQRRVDGSLDTLKARTPVVVSVTDQVNEPRYPSFKDLRAARAKPLDIWEGWDWAGPASELESLPISAIEVVAATPVQREEGVVITDSGEGGSALAAFLADKIEK